MIRRGFRYGDYDKKPKREELTAPRPEMDTPNEGLTVLVRGRDASDLEERLARSFGKFRIPFAFQVEIQTRTSMPGQDRRVDFVIRGNQPLEPDGYIGHHTVGQRGHDYLRDLQLNEAFAQMGLMPIIHIPYHKLLTQDKTDEYVRRNLA